MTSVLIVCEGNVCRSPYVERVLRARLAAADPGGFHVDSAGTHASPGTPMFPRSAQAVTRDGGDPADFASRRLTEQILVGHDLVLTLERGQRARVLDLAPGLLRRTFTLAEFDRLARPLLDGDLVGVGFWADFPALLARNRIDTAPTTPTDDDITDPVRGDDLDFEAMRTRAAAAIDTITACATRALPTDPGNAPADQKGDDRARTARP
ncbi:MULTISPECIES: low molecular weight phosphatase family protein [unclassified Curtobacterium]|uniref:arsenate reductase/protein-tyrosine-phosphatase family protein n=1 Tax=unclassified Curtobacterium TaxID=257496 RepID=UPI000FB1E3BD|nr:MULTISPECIES: low molecular weight phosphatase family protein [unclassified Curtobacterium]ROQ17732.1 protein-tyrosine phosphatase [Curtobacterium sp. PhB171]ROQ29023.1 protein-tyrosine phosphatase [Curtobacterium sp. PhB170]ROS45833.1 protein-tyrosine phosphatase [Curtobacterium sp. PhB131]ROS67865.1 protein-tyrosine phosphatase [Curtobacterium sp. PhB141]